jgi:hypothetical protein
MQMVEPPKHVRREDWVEPFYQAFASRFGIAGILKRRENARVAVSYATTAGGNRIEEDGEQHAERETVIDHLVQLAHHVADAESAVRVRSEASTLLT